jgi:hypothetical protein
LDGTVYGLPNAVVGSAPAQSCHGCIDLGVAGFWIAFQQGGCRHNLTGLAVATLRNIVLDPCLLKRVQGPVITG